MNYFFKELLIYEIKTMMCRLYGCENQAKYPFPCCSFQHGAEFKRDKENYQLYTKGLKTGLIMVQNWSVGKLVEMEAHARYSR